jgi:hypothetical protein
MRKKYLKLLSILFIITACSFAVEPFQPSAMAFKEMNSTDAQEFYALFENAENKEGNFVGNWVLNGWESTWYQDFSPVNHPQWWLEDAAVMAATSNDPVSMFVDYQDQLNKAGIELVCMYHPVRPQFYPEILSPQARELVMASSNGDPVLIPDSHRAILSAMRARGLDVIDPTYAWIANRGAMTDRNEPNWETSQIAVYSDPHPGPLANYISAQMLKRHIENRPWYKNMPAADKDLMTVEWKISRVKGVLDGSKVSNVLCPMPKMKSGQSIYSAEYASKAATGPVAIIGSSPTHWYDDYGPYFGQIAAAIGFPCPKFSQNGNFLEYRYSMIRTYRDFFKHIKCIVLIMYANNFRHTNTSEKNASTEYWKKQPLGLTFAGSIGPRNPPDNYEPWEPAGMTANDPQSTAARRPVALTAASLQFSAAPIKSDAIKVRISFAGMHSIEITTLSGRLIACREARGASSHIIATGPLAPGVYVVSVGSGTQRAAQAVMVPR